jgi:hypothetical protein
MWAKPDWSGFGSGSNCWGICVYWCVTNGNRIFLLRLCAWICIKRIFLGYVMLCIFFVRGAVGPESPLLGHRTCWAREIGTYLHANYRILWLPLKTGRDSASYENCYRVTLYLRPLLSAALSLAVAYLRGRPRCVGLCILNLVYNSPRLWIAGYESGMILRYVGGTGSRMRMEISK